MPQVDVKLPIQAPIDEVWRAVKDIESYPTYMDNVKDVRVEAEQMHGERVSTWSVLLKGSVLEWTERERVDDAAYRIEFDQIDGDLDVFTGHWQLTEIADGVEAVLLVDFEIGIPLLADMLNPVAARALHDNSEQMLLEIRAPGRDPRLTRGADGRLELVRSAAAVRAGPPDRPRRHASARVSPAPQRGDDRARGRGASSHLLSPPAFALAYRSANRAGADERVGPDEPRGARRRAGAPGGRAARPDRRSDCAVR